MNRRAILRLLLSLAGARATARAAAAADSDADAAPMAYVHAPPESPLDHRYDFEWRVLAEALERTRGTHGPYRIATTQSMTERRQVEQLQSGGGLTMMFRGTSPEMESMLRPVRIPVDLDLQGYCVLLVRRELAPRFAAVRTLADLRAFSFGLGLGWLDVDILRGNGLRVVTGSSYEGLFDMLANRRFDCFLRSAVEVLDEYDQRAASLEGVIIEPTLLLFYPMPMYFWFAATGEGDRLRGRLEQGMRGMLANGSYHELFARYQDAKIRRLALASRRMLTLRNPLLGQEASVRERAMWFDPRHYVPRY